MMPVASSAYDNQGEHNSGQHVRSDDWERREHLRAEHLRQERERRERHEREERLRRAHHNNVKHECHERNHERPAGLEHGRKRGWQGRNLPPGQEKKAGYQKDHGR